MPSRTLIMSTSIHYSERTTLRQRWMYRSSHNSPRTLPVRLSYLESKIRSVRSSWASFSMLTTLVVAVILFKEEVEIIQRLTITQSPINRLRSNNNSCFNNSRGSTTCQLEAFPIRTNTSRVTTFRCHQSQRILWTPSNNKWNSSLSSLASAKGA